MRIMYVGDNRDRVNFGCRATSIALSQMLEQHHHIVATVTGNTKAAPPRNGFPFTARFPALSTCLNWVLPRKLNRYFWRASLAIWDTDYIAGSVEQTIRNFHACRPRVPDLQALWQGIRDAEAVLINGEGSFIFRSPVRRDLMFLLMVIRLAALQGKPVYLLNTILSECPATTKPAALYEKTCELLQACKRIIVRDPHSLRTSKAMGLENCTYAPDALFSWRSFIQDTAPQLETGDIYLPFESETNDLFGRFDFSQPYILVSDRSLPFPVSDAAQIECFNRLIETFKDRFNGGIAPHIYLVQTCSGGSFLKTVSRDTGVPCLPVNMPIVAAACVLARAAVFISGRYHPAIMASLGGTPCVFMGSNSHKTMSLQEVLQYPEPHIYSTMPTESDCQSIVEDVVELLDQGPELRSRIAQRVAKLAHDTVEIYNNICC